MKKIGITGGIAMGKSTVLSIIEAVGIQTCSADSLSRIIFTTAPVQDFLTDWAIEKNPHEMIDTIELSQQRIAVRQLMGTDPEFKIALETVMHPLIREAIERHPAQVVEVPLLFENALQEDYEHIWCVTCPYDHQIKRLTERWGDEMTAKRYISMQMPILTKMRGADFIISTNQSRIQVAKRVIEGLELHATTLL